MFRFRREALAKAIEQPYCVHPELGRRGTVLGVGSLAQQDVELLPGRDEAHRPIIKCPTGNREQVQLVLEAHESGVMVLGRSGFGLVGG